MGDLPPRVEIGASRLKLLLLTVAGILLTIVSGLAAFRFTEDVQPGSRLHFAGLVGLPFFGFCLLIAFRRLFTAQGAIVTIDAEGIRDMRISSTPIPWSSVRDIKTWKRYRTRMMILSVDPEFERALKPSLFSAMMRGASRAVGADGLAIGSNDLRISHEELLKTALAYWKAGAR